MIQIIKNSKYNMKLQIWLSKSCNESSDKFRHYWKKFF